MAKHVGGYVFVEDSAADAVDHLLEPVDRFMRAAGCTGEDVGSWLEGLRLWGVEENIVMDVFMGLLGNRDIAAVTGF